MTLGGSGATQLAKSCEFQRKFRLDVARATSERMATAWHRRCVLADARLHVLAASLPKPRILALACALSFLNAW